MNPPSRYVVAGNPVAHSQSPFIHAEFARQTGEALTYDRLLCPLDAFAATVRAFAAGGRCGLQRHHAVQVRGLRPGRRAHAARRAGAGLQRACASTPAAGPATTPTAPGSWPTSATTPASRLHGRARAAGRRRRRRGRRARAAARRRPGRAGGRQPDRRAAPPRWWRRHAAAAGGGHGVARLGPGRRRPRFRHRRQCQRQQRRRRRGAGRRRGASPGSAGARHDVRPAGRALPRLGARPRRDRSRRPGHAGRAGGRGVLLLARRAAAHRRRAGGAAQRIDAR